MQASYIIAVFTRGFWVPRTTICPYVTGGRSSESGEEKKSQMGVSIFKITKLSKLMVRKCNIGVFVFWAFSDPKNDGTVIKKWNMSVSWVSRFSKILIAKKTSTGSVQSWSKGYFFVFFEISAAELLNTCCRDSEDLLLPCCRAAAESPIEATYQIGSL